MHTFRRRWSTRATTKKGMPGARFRRCTICNILHRRHTHTFHPFIAFHNIFFSKREWVFISKRMKSGTQVHVTPCARRGAASKRAEKMFSWTKVNYICVHSSVKSDVCVRVSNRMHLIEFEWKSVNCGFRISVFFFVHSVQLIIWWLKFLHDCCPFPHSWILWHASPVIDHRVCKCKLYFFVSITRFPFFSIGQQRRERRAWTARPPGEDGPTRTDWATRQAWRYGWNVAGK